MSVRIAQRGLAGVLLVTISGCLLPVGRDVRPSTLRLLDAQSGCELPAALLVREERTLAGWVAGENSGGVRSIILSRPEIYHTGDLLRPPHSSVLFLGLPWFATGLVIGNSAAATFLVVVPGYSPVGEVKPEDSCGPLGTEGHVGDRVLLLQPSDDPGKATKTIAALLARPEFAAQDAREVPGLPYFKYQPNMRINVRFTARERRIVAEYLQSLDVR